MKRQLRSALVAGQWRGDTALTLPLFWRRSTVSPVFFGRYSRSNLHSFVPFPRLSPSLISILASVDVKQNGPQNSSYKMTCVGTEFLIQSDVCLHDQIHCTRDMCLKQFTCHKKTCRRTELGGLIYTEFTIEIEVSGPNSPHKRTSVWTEFTTQNNVYLDRFHHPE